MNVMECIFCGEQTHIARAYSRKYHVECDSCGARGPGELTEERAVKRWTRHNSYRATEIVEDMRSIIIGLEHRITKIEGKIHG